MSSIGAKEVTFKKGEVVFQENDSERSMFIIKTGSVEVFKTKGADKVSLATLGPGQYFGEMGFFEDEPRSAAVVACEETKAIKIPYTRELKKQLEGAPSWIVSILKGVFTRLRAMNEEVKKLKSTAKLNYKENKEDYLTSTQCKELFRCLFIANLLVKSNKVEKAQLLSTFSDFFSSLTLGPENIVSFLSLSKIFTELAGTNPVELELIEPELLEKFIDFLRGALKTNEKRLQVTPKELRCLEVISTAMQDISTDNLDVSQITIPDEKINQTMNEMYADRNFYSYLKSLQEKGIVEKNVSTDGTTKYNCVPEEIERSIPFLKIMLLLVKQQKVNAQKQQKN